jgi:hypothetical protein
MVNRWVASTLRSLLARVPFQTIVELRVAFSVQFLFFGMQMRCIVLQNLQQLFNSSMQSVRCEFFDFKARSRCASFVTAGGEDFPGNPHFCEMRDQSDWTSQLASAS